MKKGECYEGTVTRVDYPGRGVVSVEGREILVKNTIPGQRIRLRVTKKRAGRIEGALLEVLEASPLETAGTLCSIFPDCGGCQYLSVPYEGQLEMKAAQIRRLLSPVLTAGGQWLLSPEEAQEGDAVWDGMVPSPSPYEYRNKMEFSFGDAQKGGPLTLGLHKKGSTYDILNVKDCRLVHPDMNGIVSCVRDFFTEKAIPYYHRVTHEGVLRHLMLRRGSATGEILVSIVTTSQGCPDLSPLVQRLLSLELTGRIVGIIHIVNDSLADVVRSDSMELLYGQAEFYEELLGLRFRVTPFSFFQPNSQAAERLYERVREYASLNAPLEGRVIYDLYSGTGTISQVLAPGAKEVVGVEIVPEAVDAARENAALNDLDNCRFLCGDVLKTLDELQTPPDVMILDPPRDGIHPKALPRLLSYQVPTIVYISCKPSSLARDLPAFYEAGYRVERLSCIDQFCNTVHVETVCLLSNRKPDAYVHSDVDLEDYYKIKDSKIDG